MGRKRRWSNPPSIFTTVRKELYMRQAFKVQTELLMRWETASTFPSHLGLVRVKLFNRCTKLTP
jgi:hypothetical protein